MGKHISKFQIMKRERLDKEREEFEKREKEQSEKIKSKWICEDCGEPIHRNGYSLYCENSCFEDDIRNGYSEDELEEKGIKDENYPEDENIEKIVKIKCPFCEKEFEVDLQKDLI